ncbi:MFS transporter, partial [Sulfitobacter sp. S45]|uniref:MFS transporter n=1 Tax=Sulfitobacter sp. S45 TaxID=3368581 RepID=UPI003745BEA1
LLPSPQAEKSRSFYERVTKGVRIFFATPRLRGLLLLNLCVSGAGAMVLVNTIVLVKGDLALNASWVGIALGIFGCGSIAVAFSVSRVLKRVSERTMMLGGAATMSFSLLALAVFTIFWQLNTLAMCVTWFVLGIGYSSVLTPVGLVLTRSAHPEDRPSIFAAQFTLSHSAWLITYPLAGWLITEFGLVITLVSLGTLTTLAMITASRLWPHADKEELTHRHDDLPEGHPHIAEGREHVHAFIIDDLHRAWPQL